MMYLSAKTSSNTCTTEYSFIILTREQGAVQAQLLGCRINYLLGGVRLDIFYPYPVTVNITIISGIEDRHQGGQSSRRTNIWKDQCPSYDLCIMIKYGLPLDKE